MDNACDDRKALAVSTTREEGRGGRVTREKWLFDIGRLRIAFTTFLGRKRTSAGGEQRFSSLS